MYVKYEVIILTLRRYFNWQIKRKYNASLLTEAHKYLGK